MFPKDENYDLTGPHGTQIMVYEEKREVELDIVIETSKRKMPRNEQEVCFL